MPAGDAPFWRAIDWRAPWLAPYAGVAPPVIERLERGDGVAAALGDPRFVPQAELPAGEAYESFIRRSGRVPTRDNLHDLFNGLVWLRFPALKARLNELHAAQIALEGVAAVRGPLRDALTLFDENGATLEAPPALLDAWRRRDWHSLFVRQRPLWRDVRLTLVGHGLLERLLQPRPAITAHALAGAPEGAFADGRPPAFLPLPVLGVPGWWDANADPRFYDDAQVFRRGGRVTAGTSPSSAPASLPAP